MEMLHGPYSFSAEEIASKISSWRDHKRCILAGIEAPAMAPEMERKMTTSSPPCSISADLLPEAGRLILAGDRYNDERCWRRRLIKEGGSLRSIEIKMVVTLKEMA
nr:hypothetical protein Itr_chr06CG20090 [Ipomoea trifida]